MADEGFAERTVKNVEREHAASNRSDPAEKFNKWDEINRRLEEGDQPDSVKEIFQKDPYPDYHEK